MSHEVTAANAILKTIERCEDGDVSVLLSTHQRTKLKEACIFVRSNINWKFSFKSFFQNICHPIYLPLEMIWKLHSVGLLPLEMYLALKADNTIALDMFYKGFDMLCISDLATDEASPSIVSGILSLAIVQCFGDQDSEDSVTFAQSKKVFQNFLEKTLKSVAESHLNSGSVMRLNPVLLAMDNKFLDTSLLNAFSQHLLNFFTTYGSPVSAFDALQEQEKIFNITKNSPIVDVLLKVYTTIQLESLNPILYGAATDSRVNWKMSLALLHSFLMFGESSSANVLSLVDNILELALKEKNFELLSSSFLIIRHCTLVGSPYFALSYSAWFKKKFCTDLVSYFVEEEVLSFFTNFLTCLVPAEEECYLQAHVENKPCVPNNYRFILMDYIKLARTKLDDIKAKDLTGSVLEKMITSFEATNKIPSTIMEASMLQKHNYLTQFLPNLLAPRVLPSKPDSRMKLIEALKVAKKIPKDIYERYITECERLAAEELVVCLEDSFDAEFMDIT